MDVFSMGPGLTSETAGVASHLFREMPGLEGLVFVVASQTLFAGGYQTELVFLEAVHVRFDGVELATVSENGLEDEGRSLVECEPSLLHEVQAVLSQSQCQFDPVVGQKVPTMATNLLSSPQISNIEFLSQLLVVGHLPI